MVSLILVSHSKKIAEGAKELAGEVAGGAEIIAIGGANDGGLGSDYDSTKQAIEAAIANGEAVVLFDLGSTLMTIQMIFDELDELAQQRIKIVDAALVEGAIVAAVGIAAGMNLEAIVNDLAALKLGKIDN